MTDTLETLKTELEQFGEANDAATNERGRRIETGASRRSGAFD